ncbi:MAG TPA: TspO/MBR family protein, partial [Luteolibacter sp.]|nr:TspO/MBR family protein [Luteolibacter sp.]
LLLNAAWTPVVFGLREPGWAFAVIIAMWFAIWLTMRVFARIDRAAAWLLAPYAAWVTFAAVLNFTLWRMNP